jgi:signal transduction histidine kinase
MTDRKKGAQFQLTSRFVAILTGLLLIVNVAFVTISLYSVYYYLADQAKEIATTLEEVPQATDDWDALVDVTIAKNEEDAVRILLTDGPTYYSKDGKEIFTELAEGTALPIFKGIILMEDEIYYFQRHQQQGRTVEIAIHGNTVIEMMMRMLVISVLLNLFAVLIGSWIIYFFVGKWSKTLQQMTQEMKEIELTNNQAKLLSVPETPSEIKQAASSFNQLLRMQREAMKREGQFVTDASHELRTPLTAIRGHVQLIKRRGSAHPEVIAPSIDFIDKESKRLETMTNQLLLLGKHHATQVCKEVDFSVLVQQEVQKLQASCPQEVTFDIQENIHMYADELELQQICQNLFGNARKYSAANETIHIRLQANETIRLDVTDTGEGIPDEMKGRIFERFFRVDSSRSSQVEGSGIGLAIVASIVEKYQGKLSVADNQPKGSIFTVEFPKK